MKYLILGAGGQLGSEWIQVMEHREAGDSTVKGLSSAELDITDYDALKATLHSEEPDLIINCAAYTDVDGAEEDREIARRVNSGAVANLANLCSRSGCKLVHFSTDYVFSGSLSDRMKFPRGYPEEHRTAPVNWYGETKWRGEQAIRQSGVEHLIIRVSWLCGQYGRNFVTTMLELARKRDFLDVVNDQWGSPTFTRQVVDQTLTLLRKSLTGTYHLTSKGVITWYDLAKEIFTLKKMDIKVKPVSSERFAGTAARPAFSKLDTRKFEEQTGDKVIDWRLGLENLLTQLDNH
ncbi:MAG: dTDP-4-dehydrorhamnose reductase [Balneolaceae bacterium]|nr:dTDP-4-dehydrorhamnose reductase [Balneolaceae bacterium]